MMKIQIMAGDTKHIQFGPLLRKEVLSILNDHDIHFVDKNPDMFLYHTYRAPKELYSNVFKSKIPVMILERIAAARIFCRKEILFDNVVGVLKDTIYRDLNIENTDFEIHDSVDPEMNFKNNHHSKLISIAMGYKHNFTIPKILIPQECFKKVKLWYSFSSYDMMNPWISNPPKDSQKTIDVSFIGTTKYSGSSEMITAHRKKCISEMNNLKNCQTFVSAQRLPGKKNYIDNLSNTKISVSPWGLGEKCYRDFESIYANCLVIKPDTNFVLDWTDTYDPSNNYYVPCRIDFSDLQEKIDHIKTNWKDFVAIRKRARDRQYSSCWDNTKIALHVKKIFEECASNIKV